MLDLIKYDTGYEIKWYSCNSNNTSEEKENEIEFLILFSWICFCLWLYYLSKKN